MNYYTPQPIGVYSVMAMQSFRRGNCGNFYENRYIADADEYAFPPILVKRLTVGGTATITLVTLEDVDIATFTPPSQTNYTLDDGVDAYEMLVLAGGTWTSLVSAADGDYYFRIESGAGTWYTDAFHIEQATGADFPQCSDGWVKLSWTGSDCITAGLSTDNTTPVLAYPDVALDFFVYLRANLSQPEWEYEEEGEDDASKIFIPDSRKMAKRWKLEGYPVSEAVVDAIHSSALFDTITIEFPDSPEISGLKEVKIEMNWENGGCFATFQYTFTSDYLLKQGCC